MPGRERLVGSRVLGGDCLWPEYAGNGAGSGAGRSKIHKPARLYRTGPPPAPQFSVTRRSVARARHPDRSARGAARSRWASASRLGEEGGVVDGTGLEPVTPA